jgi:drug/metabolite transporter (DMT)-like permease
MIMLPVVLAMRLVWRISPADMGLVVLRSVFLILSTYTFVAAIRVMPIADALAIAFVEPFILLFLGRFLFGDEVGPRRIAASCVGFGGALLVIQPSLAVFGPVALYPLGTAFSFAFYMLSTRQLAARLHPVTMQLHTSIAGALICVPLLWAFDGSGIGPLDPVWPQGLGWVWLAGVGFWAAVSHLCMTYALKYAPSATLAPLHYLEIVAAVTLGYLVFGDFPNPMTWAGIATICASGLYIISRERAADRRRRAAEPVSPAPAPPTRP